MDLGNWLGALIIGGLAGWVASMIMKTNASMGVFMNILVGIIGAVIGNLLLPLFGASGTTGFNLWSFVVALIGAVVLLFLVKLFTGNKPTAE
ncbi:transglycosylase [Candidatus Saccharibacteria bacterium RAAC3_TM7_1]|nr:transglycosylase [Candidatus Saccharibacteria bacterium RAAC3_TM7_1]HCZ28896.1 GlsB/YeaQ/YmgE family stress response membrane protein [Candidatus Saccharibacteria bacterium]